MSGSPYEQWVIALRQWQHDPATDLRSLPALRADSLPPDAYQRLFAHMRTAVDTMMLEFSQLLVRDIGAARSEHDYARAMVGLRVRLARRVQLAEHPGLPAEVRAELAKGVEADVNALQAQVEELVTASADRYGSDRTHTEHMLRIVRQNRFTVVLEPGFPLEALLAGQTGFGSTAGFAARGSAHAPPGPAGAAVPQPVPTSGAGFVRRRVFLGDNRPPV
ncbi:hypothetical protein ACFQNE_05750 [Gordonia phosphorivorans]|uniref:Uncharacterized protein n=1 Tax=Gordonia phosphorivorans TaxID=1056982 RepID=A0ABV6H529_9ACTN